MQLPVGYLSYGSEPISRLPMRGGSQLEDITRNIAISKPEGGVGLADILAELEPLVGSNTALVVITASGSVASPGHWVSALHGLARRGVNITVALLDRESFLDIDQRSGGNDDSNRDVLAELVGAGIRTYQIKQGQPVDLSLTDQVREFQIALPVVGEDGVIEQIGVEVGDGE